MNSRKPRQPLCAPPAPARQTEELVPVVTWPWVLSDDLMMRAFLTPSAPVRGLRHDAPAPVGSTAVAPR